MSAPGVVLLDARERQLDGPGLRAWARQAGAATGAAHVSRSYRDPHALLAWHERRVGVDLERLEPLDRDFAESIATPDELRELDPRLDSPAFVASLWCSKEALAKALGDAVAYDPRRLRAPLTWPGAVAGRWRAQPLPGMPDGHVAWLCWEETTTWRKGDRGRGKRPQRGA